MRAALLDVVIPYCNPLRWHSRLKNLRRAETAMLASGVRLTTVELAYGHRPFELPPHDGIRRVQVRGHDVLWHKENLINIGFAAIPDWQYGAYVDGDMLFHDPDWPAETVHALQLHAMVQISTDLIWLGPSGGHVGHSKSFMHCYSDAVARRRAGKYYHPSNPTELEHGYPGCAWAYRRDAWQAMGGLLDVCILGAADFHMARALFGMDDLLLSDNDYTPGYRDALKAWRDKAVPSVKQNVGSVPGLIFHLWHGALANRRYSSREQILIRNHFDPTPDLTRDHQGLICLASNKPQLRRDLFDYFASREEDE